MVALLINEVPDSKRKDLTSKLEDVVFRLTEESRIFEQYDFLMKSCLANLLQLADVLRNSEA